jgi:RNA-directed DNA polymerase
MSVTAVTCAPSEPTEWHDIDWKKCHRRVKKLQVRIAKAVAEGRWGKVKALQWLLTHAFAAKAVAVRRVTENRGKNTAGVDGETWSTPKAKAKAITRLRRHGYHPQPLKRSYLVKENGKRRPLGIPCMIDRAMQALHLLTLEPVAESIADKNSYGFRPERSPADAIGQCRISLSRRTSAKWILRADIRSCFDEISHRFLEATIPMDKEMLRKWLKAGYLDRGSYYPTEAGIAQGSPCSPVILNLTLDGLEKTLADHFKKKEVRKTYPKAKVHAVRFADDIAITGSSKEILTEEVKPVLKRFLAERGLELSEEKTTTFHIQDGFDFLGQNLRKYKGKFITKPAKKNVQSFLTKVRKLIKMHQQSSQADLITALNPVIRGWANYHRHICAKETFSSVDNRIWLRLWRWAKRRHPTKSSSWVRDRYFHCVGSESWVFGTYRDDPTCKTGKRFLRLSKASKTPIKRHIKIKGDANPYDPRWETYFEARLARKMTDALKGRQRLLALWSRQSGKCLVCQQSITQQTSWNLHHLVEKARGGTDTLPNLTLLHPTCHQQLHNRGFSVQLAGST